MLELFFSSCHFFPSCPFFLLITIRLTSFYRGRFVIACISRVCAAVCLILQFCTGFSFFSLGWIVIDWFRLGAAMILAWGDSDPGLGRQWSWLGAAMILAWGDMERVWGDSDPGLGRQWTGLGRQWYCAFGADSPGLQLHNMICFLTICRCTSNHQ